MEIENREELLQKIPEFDLYEFSAIESIRLDWCARQPESGLSVELVGIYRSEDQARRVEFQFLGVRQLKLPDLSDRGLFLNELELEDVSGQQLEGVRFRLENHGTEEFSLCCRSVKVVSVI